MSALLQAPILVVSPDGIAHAKNPGAIFEPVYMSSLPSSPIYPVTSTWKPIIISFGRPILKLRLTHECAPSAPQSIEQRTSTFPVDVEIVIPTVSSSCSAEIGLLDSQRSAPDCNADSSIDSSNNFLQTLQVLTVSGEPIETTSPEGP